MTTANEKHLAPIETDSHDDEDEDDDDDEDNEGEEYETTKGWISKLALFGDSGWSLAVSSLVLLIALATNWYILSESDSLPPDPYKFLGPVPRIDPPYFFELPESVLQPNSVTTTTPLVSKKMFAAFEKDGVVAIRGLLTRNQMDRLDVASRKIIEQQLNASTREQRKLRPSTQFFTVRDNLALHQPPPGENRSAFLDVAMLSKIPIIAAELMRMKETDGENLRLLRDIFLAKDDEQYICGWHVDDVGFWPATASSPGVNAWIAIDDMPSFRGGGFALAVGSHNARWKEEAYNVTGATPTLPPQGYKTAADFFANRTGSGTCNIAASAPHLHRRMEETKRIYEVQRGDVIFTTRWLFHKTVPFDQNETAKYLAEQGIDELIYRRYSVRYAPGSARIPPGFTLEPSVLWNAENGGKTADAISQDDGPWYPQCWPTVIEHEMEQLKDLSRNKLPIAEERKAARFKEIQPFLKAFSKKQEQTRRKHS